MQKILNFGKFITKLATRTKQKTKIKKKKIICELKKLRRFTDRERLTRIAPRT